MRTKRTRGPSRSPEPAISGLFELKMTGSKGRGAFAVEDIQPGQILLKETAMMVFHEPILEGALDKTFSALSTTEAHAFLQLYEGPFDCGSKIERIFYTNAVAYGEGEAGFSCLYPRLSYINHSCSPNAELSDVTYTTIETVRANRLIKKGEEITISYLADHFLLSTASRQEQLSSGWGFLCRCTSCLDPVSSLRRELISWIYGVLGLTHSALETADYEAALELDSTLASVHCASVRTLNIFYADSIVPTVCPPKYPTELWYIVIRLLEKEDIRGSQLARAYFRFHNNLLQRCEIALRAGHQVPARAQLLLDETAQAAHEHLKSCMDSDDPILGLAEESLSKVVWRQR